MHKLQAASGAALAKRPQVRPTVRARLILFIISAVIIMAADILSKIWAVAALSDGHSIRLFGGLLYLSLTRNTGAAFSLASGFTVVLALIAIVVVGVIVRLARRLPSNGWALALGLVLGGALGNLTDRLFRAPGILRGAVVDFFSLLDPINPPWPVFNVADSALVVGVCIAVFLELSGRHLTFKSQQSTQKSAESIQKEPGEK